MGVQGGVGVCVCCGGAGVGAGGRRRERRGGRGLEAGAAGTSAPPKQRNQHLPIACRRTHARAGGSWAGGREAHRARGAQSGWGGTRVSRRSRSVAPEVLHVLLEQRVELNHIPQYVDDLVGICLDRAVVRVEGAVLQVVDEHGHRRARVERVLDPDAALPHEHDLRRRSRPCENSYRCIPIECA
jgi:hypothetical protein